MQKICKNCQAVFEITDFETGVFAKLGVPEPTLCIDERHRRRLSHRNERKIYKDTCDLTGKPIISLFSPDKNITAYSQDAWWGDSWDPRDHGRDFDFNRSFFEQFHELELAVPHLSLMNMYGENSEFCNITTGNKNCYLVFGGDINRDCMYSVFNMGCTDTADVYWVNKSELVYDSVDLDSCYHILYSRNCFSCSEGAFLFECRNCEKCFGCVGLIGKKYHIFNVQYSPEEYEEKIKEFHLDSFEQVEKIKAEFEAFILKFPHRSALIVNSENCTGDIIYGSKNCQNCFCANPGTEDCKDLFLSTNSAKDIVSSDHIGHKGELYYECMGSITSTNCAFCLYSWQSPYTYYCNLVANCHDLFGCTNMRRNEYCILNKQYSKEDYLALREKIIEHMKKTGEWGEAFPMQNSIFAYNETVANDYFPITREEALKQGLKWLDEELKSAGTGPEIPDSIRQVTDEILNQTLVCQKTGRTYRIIKQELDFYRKMGIPVPHFAPETRTEMRIKLRKPPHVWSRICSNCKKPILTSYSPDRPEVVYCEECYLKTVY
ncbi:MAG: hypothetical protein WC897_00315 [Candidatus Gracilibacteria bacterium]